MVCPSPVGVCGGMIQQTSVRAASATHGVREICESTFRLGSHLTRVRPFRWLRVTRVEPSSPDIFGWYSLDVHREWMCVGRPPKDDKTKTKKKKKNGKGEISGPSSFKNKAFVKSSCDIISEA